MTESHLPDQHGRIALITGANSGLGLETARALAGAGATVWLACRNPERAATALEQVATVATGDAPRTVALDLSDLDSVAAAAEEVAGAVDRLDVLVNNAGIMAVPKGRTAQGFESQFGVNHLGHYALTGRLLPTLLAASAPRVVSVSSGAHRAGRMHWDDLDATPRIPVVVALWTVEAREPAVLGGTEPPGRRPRHDADRCRRPSRVRRDEPDPQRSGRWRPAPVHGRAHPGWRQALRPVRCCGGACLRSTQRRQPRWWATTTSGPTG